MATNDPHGILQRIPELEQLQDVPGVAKAIAQGDLHVVYRKLFWAKLTGKAKDKHELIDLLLSRRRIFLTPIKSAPTLQTLNGFGGAVYGGRDRDPNDGTYIKTHYLVFAFLPVFPVSQYLVRDAQPRGWGFIGKVPFDTLHWAWRSVLALAVGVGVLVAGASAFDHSRYNDVHVVNGLPIAVEARVGAKQVTVQPGGRVTLHARVGQQAVEIKSASGRLIERGTLEVKSATDVLVWNVAGAAPVVHELVVYSQGSDQKGPEPDVSCGVNVVEYRNVDFAFTEPPKEISLSDKQASVSRSHVFFPDGGPGLCMGWLLMHERGKDACALSRRLTEIAGYTQKLVLQTGGLCSVYGAEDETVSFYRAALAKNPADVELHRGYQALMVALGRRDEVLAEYRERQKAAPDDVVAGYLRARMESGERANALFEELSKHAPKNPYVLRAVAYQRLLAHDFGAAWNAWQQIASVDRAAYSESTEMMAYTLVGLGRVADAQKLVRDDFAEHKDAKDDDTAFERALCFASLAQLDPSQGLDPDELLRVLPASPETPELAAWFHVLSGTARSEDDLARLEGPKHDAAVLALALRDSAATALDKASHTNASALRKLPLDMWLLLYAEAVRVTPPEQNEIARTVLASRPSTHGLLAAVSAYVRDGTANASIEELEPSTRAVLHFVRSRNEQLAEADRAALLAQVSTEDLLHGVATQAARAWTK